MTYPLSFRRKVLSVREQEGHHSAGGCAFWGGHCQCGALDKKPIPKETRNKPATKIDMAALARDVREYPDAYQAERARRLGVSEKGIGHALRVCTSAIKKHCSTPGRTKTNGASSRRRFKRIRLNTASSSILIKWVCS